MVANNTKDSGTAEKSRNGGVIGEMPHTLPNRPLDMRWNYKRTTYYGAQNGKLLICLD